VAILTRRLLLLAAALFGLGAAVPLLAQTASEDEVKAAFLFNFAKFVEWPAEALGESQKLVVGVLGDDDFAAMLEKAIAGKSAGGHSIAVERLAVPDKDKLAACHILFVSPTQNERLGPLLASTANTALLTVGERDEFVDRGGIIAFTVQDNKLRFSINATAAEKARLKISSQLTKLALRVVQ